MKKIRYGLIVFLMLSCMVTSATAQVSIGIGLPNVSIGINLPLFPRLVPVPGYPVYYAPQVNGNYFFYDGMYWVYQDDNWYTSFWYNGPWGYVAPEVVPLFILRIPVRYYRQPPAYFRGWQSNAPPRWGHHWGRDWEKQRRGWDRWNRRAVPGRAPLPFYQQKYSEDRYPQFEHQQSLRSRHYRYQPRDRAVRQHINRQTEQRIHVPDQRGRQESPPVISPRQPETRRPAPDRNPVQQRGPAVQEQRQRPNVQHEQRDSESRDKERGFQDHIRRSQDRSESQEPSRGHGQGRDRDEERGRGRDK